MNELLINFVLGGFTGYITNNVAIKMLFKEYFGFGGVIEKEYEDFIENISKLIERDLINDKTLKDEITNEKFKNSLKKVIKDILLIQLPKINGNTFIYEVDGFNETKENIFKFIDSKKDAFFKEVISIYQEKKVNSLISEHQFNEIIKNLSLEIEKNKSEIENLVYDFLSTKKIEELVSNSAIYKIRDNLKQEIKNINFKEFDGDFNKVYFEFLEVVDIDEVIKKIEENLSNRYLSDFINDSDGLSQELIKRVLKILSTEEGSYLLENLILNLIDALKHINVSIFEVLNSNVENNIKYFIQEKLPDIIDNLIRFMQRNKREIERRINEDIDYVLDKGIGGKIIKFIKDIIYDDFASDKNLVGEIIKAIENYGDKAGDELSKKLLESLKKYTIGEIIEILENNGLLNPSKLARLIQVNLRELQFQKIDAIDEFLSKQIKDVLNVNLEFLKIDVLPKLFENVKEKYIYQERFKNDINKALSESIEKLKSKRLDNFISEENISADFNYSKLFNYSMLNVKIKELVEIKNIDIEYKDFIEKFENLKFNNVYTKLQKESTYEELSNLVLALITKNLKTIFENNVSSAVASELHKFSSSQIRDMVENFMGKELKPINTLGAILGSIGGGGYYASTLFVNVPYLNYATPIIYGATGIFTNHLAIEMLFKPYEKKWYLPFFSPGVVAKKKPEFATNIANFVKDDILTDEALNKSFKNYKDTLKTFLVEFIKKNNYEKIDNTLKLHADEITNYILEAFLNYLSDNSILISQIIVKKIDELDFSEYSENIAKVVSKKIYEMNFSDYLKNYLDSKELIQFTPYILKFVDENFDLFIEKVVDILDYENVKKLILKYEEEYKTFVETHDLSYFINDKVKQIIVENLNQKMLELVKNDELIDSVIEKFDRGLNPNQRLKDAFGGALDRVIDRNIDYLIEEAIRYVQSLKGIVEKGAIDNLPWGTGWALKGKVKQVIEKIFEDTVPYFLYEKKEEINQIVKKLLNYKISDLGIDGSSINKDALKHFASRIFESYEFRVSVNALSNVFVDSLLTLKLADVLKILNIRNLRQLIDIVSPILEDGLNVVQDNLEKNQNKLKIISKEFLEKILVDISKNKKLSILFEGVDISKESKTILALFKEKEKDLNYLLEDVLNGLFSKEFYSKGLLEKDLNEFIKSSLQEDREVIKDKISIFIKDLLVNLNSIVDEKTKDYLVNVLSEAIFNSLEDNIEDLIKSIDIKEVIIREINNMHPKEIEDMFNSFASSYFTKLKLYGGFGAVFGIPSIFI